MVLCKASAAKAEALRHGHKLAAGTLRTSWRPSWRARATSRAHQVGSACMSSCGLERCMAAGIPVGGAAQDCLAEPTQGQGRDTLAVRCYAEKLTCSLFSEWQWVKCIR